jgi:ankyrin repeat protein
MNRCIRSRIFPGVLVMMVIGGINSTNAMKRSHTDGVQEAQDFQGYNADVWARIIAFLYPRQKNMLHGVCKFLKRIASKENKDAIISHDPILLGVGDLAHFKREYSQRLREAEQMRSTMNNADAINRCTAVINRLRGANNYVSVESGFESECVSATPLTCADPDKYEHTWNLLYDAICLGSLEKVTPILKEQTTVHENLITDALKIAVIRNKVDIVKHLFEFMRIYIEDYDRKFENRNECLELACLRGYTEIVDLFLTFFAIDVNAPISHWYVSPMISRYCDDNCADLSMGPRDKVGLYYSKYRPRISLCTNVASLGNVALMELMLKHGASICHKQGESDLMPLTTAALHGHSALVRLLLGRGASANEYNDTISFNYPLTAAAWSGDLDTINILLAHGALVDAQNKNFTTALDIAIERSNDTVVRRLIEAGANRLNIGIDFRSINFTKSDQTYEAFGLCSTLDRAVATDNIEITKLLLSYNPPIYIFGGDRQGYQKNGDVECLFEGKHARTMAERYTSGEMEQIIGEYYSRGNMSICLWPFEVHVPEGYTHSYPANIPDFFNVHQQLDEDISIYDANSDFARRIQALSNTAQEDQSTPSFEEEDEDNDATT